MFPVDAKASPSTGWDCHVHVFGAGLAAPGAHYQPVPHTLADIEAVGASHGITRLVLVQPSVYGTDNRVLLQALRRRPGQHRGVVVLHGREDAAELAALHDAGVRAVRFNLVSPVGSGWADAQAALQMLAPRLRTLGWHVQWYARASELPRLAALQGATGLPFVLDHLAGLGPASAHNAQAWQALAQLAAGGAWVKLSGWYRLEAEPPYTALLPLVRRVATLFGDRLVWGSDWPHTSFAPDRLPPYDSLWQPVVQALGEAQATRVRHAGAALCA